MWFDDGLSEDGGVLGVFVGGLVELVSVYYLGWQLAWVVDALTYILGVVIEDDHGVVIIDLEPLDLGASSISGIECHELDV